MRVLMRPSEHFPGWFLVAYLDIDLFKERTIMPSAHVDEVETVHPGFWSIQFEIVSRKIDSRLRKRYAVPFADATIPETVRLWTTQIVTFRGYMRRGVDQSDAQFELVKNDHDDAWKEIAEAADGEAGLFDLPLVDAEDASAITRQPTRAYSESSPYVGFSKQADAGHEEDADRDGTYT